MVNKNWLYKDSVDINENIKIRIPTVREILEHEDEYYGLISLLTAMPIDLLVQLDDLGIDYTKINDYELFLLMFPMVQQSDTSMIFSDLDLSKFQMAMNSETNSVVYVNPETGVVIDRRIQQQIAAVLRRILQDGFIRRERRVLPITYVADFYIEYAGGHSEVIDIKGCPDATAKIKRKLFWYRYPELDYIWITYVKKFGGWGDYDEINRLRKEAKRKKKEQEEKGE